MAQGARTRRIPQADAVTPNSSHQPHSSRLSAENFYGKRVHLIGVGGTGMRGAARMLLRRGAIVSGSDIAPSDATRSLEAEGVAVRIGHRAENVPAGAALVVYSAAVKPDNVELADAARRGIDVAKYSDLLGRLMRGREGIAVAGTHGKSTTTAMTAYVLQRAGLDPSYVIGAVVEQLGGSSGVGSGPHFVVEACEYDRSFLHLAPRYATLLNVEEDHLDYYSDLKDIVAAFHDFAALVPPDGALIVNGESRTAMRAVQKAAAPVETFGFRPGMTWQAIHARLDGGCYRFGIAYEGRPLAETRLGIPGRHHVANALATIAICRRSGVPIDVIARVLPEFTGAQRRLTLRGTVDGVTVLDDYAHHPTEIQVTLRAARDRYRPRRLWVVFQPHQHSRTRFLLADFARSFGLADMVVVPDIYFVRDSQEERALVASVDLVEKIHAHGGDARYEPEFGRIVEQLASALQPGDVVLTMGAGDVWRVADELVARLSGSAPMGEYVDGRSVIGAQRLRDVG